MTDSRDASTIPHPRRVEERPALVSDNRARGAKIIAVAK
jgi:hypothetical protein